MRQEVPKDFFSEKRFSAKFSKSLKIQFFCTIFFPFCQTQDFCMSAYAEQTLTKIFAEYVLGTSMRVKQKLMRIFSIVAENLEKVKLKTDIIFNTIQS